MKNNICILLLSVTMLTTSQNAQSQTEPENRPPAWVGITIGSTKEGASQVLMDEYSVIVSKYGNTGKQWWRKFKENISAEDQNRLEQIFKQMSVEQQARQKVAFIKPPQPLKKLIPSDKEFNAFKNENVYGVWIDGKKVDNYILNRYSSTDFEQVTVSKLYGAAKQNKTYSYQVGLITKNYHSKHSKEALTGNEIQIVFRD